MKQRIAFYLRKFLIGGIETTLTQYLTHIDPNLYDVTLVIGIKTYPVSPFLATLPKHVKIKYIVDESFMSAIPIFQHVAPKNKLQKTLYSLISKPISKFYLRTQVVKELNTYDCTVDYSLNLDYLAEKVTCRKIGYFHFRLSHHYTPNKVTKRLNKVLPMYDNVVVISEAMLNDARKIFNHCHDKFILMYNQFEQSKIINLANSGDLEDLPESGYIVSCGRLSESQKDFTTLISAYNKLKGTYHRSEKLLIVGDGADRELLQSQINKLDLQDDVILLGFRKNPFYLISKAKIFVLSSKHEGLPGVLIEAMMLGVPILSTDCPDGPAEMLMNGAAGCLVKIGDVDQMADKINYMLDSEEVLKKYVSTATEHINRFEINSNLERLYKILDGTL